MFAASTHATSLSSEAIAAAIFAVLLIVGCIAWAIVRQRAPEPHWTISMRHAMSEAGFRLSATWAEFADWMKIGR